MLEAAVIAMTVMGCNHQTEDCKVIAQPPKVWQSQSACDAAIPQVLEGALQAPYPVIVARCKAKPSKTVEVKAEPPKSIGTAKPEIRIVELPPPPKTAEASEVKTAETNEAKTDDTALPPIAKLAVQRTTEGWTLVRKSTVDGIERIRGGVKTGVERAVGGVKSVVGGAVGLAERGADAVRDVLVPKE